MDTTFKINMHYDNIEKYYTGMKKPLAEVIFRSVFLNSYNDVANIVNKHLDYANATWDKTGKPTSFGSYVEDINPEYVEHIRQIVKPDLDMYNHKLQGVVQFELDEYSNIRAYDVKHPDVKIWFDMTPIKSES